jgi:hypothetical protein
MIRLMVPVLIFKRDSKHKLFSRSHRVVETAHETYSGQGRTPGAAIMADTIATTWVIKTKE